jgi:hypothetical protein
MRATSSRKKWSDLSSAQQTAILVAASIELSLTITSLIDLARRPGNQIRGPKAAWVAGVFVQPVGPIAYLTLGIRHGDAK